MVIYNPLLSHLGLVVCKDFSFLYQDEEVKQVFNPTPFVSFCSVRTLRSHLLKAKVYPVGERLVELWKSNKNSCQICKNVRETGTFQYFVDKIHVAINFWPTFCRVRYVVCNIMFKHAGGIIIRITIGKVS